jgi:peptidoglycan hydrolase-like protein with peptidoglycan-binding domain
MRYRFFQRGLIFAAMAAGAWSLPALGARSSAQTSSTTPVHKKSSGTTGHSSTGSSTTASTKKATVSTTKKTATSAKGSHAKASHKSKRVRGQEAPTPERINEIQEALASKGAFAGTPSGQWDDSTVDAMKKFQASHGLDPTGKLDALTLQKLGLGSQTAGLAAPTPPPNAVNRLRNVSSLPAEPDDSQN